MDFAENSTNHELFGAFVSQFVQRAQVTEVLDYGPGRWFPHLRVGHKVRLQAYDPTKASLAAQPTPTQLVTCSEITPDALGEIETLTFDLAMFAIPNVDWLLHLIERWELELVQRTETGYMTVVSVGDQHLRRASNSSGQLDAEVGRIIAVR